MLKESLDLYIVMVVSCALVLFIIVMFVLFTYRFQKRLQQKREENFRNILLAQEEERKRIASDIHDGLGGILGLLKINILDGMEEVKSNKQYSDALNNSLNLIDEAIVEARNASNNLMPVAIKRFGLPGAINDLVEQNRKFFEVEFNIDCPEDLSELMQIHIYRLLNELFNNARKHSHATKIVLEVVNDNRVLEISFSDNGIGFNFKELLKSSEGNGLKNINNRVKLLKGEFEVLNTNGTLYQLTFKNYETRSKN